MCLGRSLVMIVNFICSESYVSRDLVLRNAFNQSRCTEGPIVDITKALSRRLHGNAGKKIINTKLGLTKFSIAFLYDDSLRPRWAECAIIYRQIEPVYTGQFHNDKWCR
jgi:hypothetical protein